MRFTPTNFRRQALTSAILLALAGAAQAQASSATIKGQLVGAQSGQSVVAVNKATGAVYRAKTLADGSYTLLGLPPGNYSVSIGEARRGGVEVTVKVGETAAIDLKPVESLNTVVVVGSAARAEVKNTESATSVSARQIEALPQVTRNFLAFADLAPGVLFVNDPATGYTRLQSGAQSSDRVNVYIDGMSQKNDLTRGGVSGQNESRGNPFPQSAIAEYRIITQGYKAEYGTVSSTAISAVTKSGTNELQGDAFVDYAGGSMIAYSPFEKAAESTGVKRPKATQWQYGLSVGGPIVQDRMHFFFSYEGKNNTIPTAQTTSITGANSLAGVTVTPWLQQNLLDKQWNADRGFHEDLFFAKLSGTVDEHNRYEVSGKLRRETDDGWLTSVDHPDWGFSLPSNSINRKNTETRLSGKWELSADQWINEANAEMFWTRYTPEATDMSPFIEYKRANWSGVMMSGRMEDRSKNNSNSLTLKDDFTYSGISGHVIKAGASLNTSRYEVGGSRFAVPHYFLFIGDNGQPQTIADTGNTWLVDAAHPCNKLDGIYAAPTWEPFSCTGAPAVYNNYRNNKIGLYLQDDIALSKQVELNAGLRWDYEDNAFNNKYLTPQWVQDKFAAVDTRGGAKPGQTYAQSLANGGINISDYISTGSQRKAFSGAIQPRLGISFDVNGDKSTVLLAQAGRAYDRTPAMKARDELINNSYASPSGGAFEIWMLNNHLKMPYSDQFGLSLRQQLGAWNAEAGVQQVHSHNEFTWRSGGRNPDGSVSGNPWEPDSLAPGGITGRLLLGDSVIETKTDKFFISADKPYSKASGWGASGTLTVSKAYTNAALLGAESGTGNQYSFVVVPNLVKAIDVEPYRFVGTLTSDLGWGVIGSLKATYGGKASFMGNDCSVNAPAGCTHRVIAANHFEQVDVAFSKEMAFGPNRYILRADVLNLFNKANYGDYNTWNGWNSPDPNFGQPIKLRGAMRTLKIGATMKF